MSEPTAADLAVQHALRLKYGIEQHISTLIKQGAEAVYTLRAPSGPTPMEESQFRNLLNVALETSSVDVITNFIRYQIGRFPKVWGTEAKQFGPTLIRDIEIGAVYKAAEAVKATLKDFETQWRAQLGDNNPGEALQDAYLLLTRLYLGYARRTFTYCKKREDAKDEHAWDNLFRSLKGGESAA